MDGPRLDDHPKMVTRSVAFPCRCWYTANILRKADMEQYIDYSEIDTYCMILYVYIYVYPYKETDLTTSNNWRSSIHLQLTFCWGLHLTRHLPHRVLVHPGEPHRPRGHGGCHGHCGDLEALCGVLCQQGWAGFHRGSHSGRSCFVDAYDWLSKLENHNV